MPLNTFNTAVAHMQSEDCKIYDDYGHRDRTRSKCDVVVRLKCGLVGGFDSESYGVPIHQIYLGSVTGDPHLSTKTLPLPRWMQDVTELVRCDNVVNMTQIVDGKLITHT